MASSTESRGWVPRHKEDIKLLESVRGRAVKMVKICRARCARSSWGPNPKKMVLPTFPSLFVVIPSKSLLRRMKQYWTWEIRVAKVWLKKEERLTGEGNEKQNIKINPIYCIDEAFCALLYACNASHFKLHMWLNAQLRVLMIFLPLIWTGECLWEFQLAVWWCEEAVLFSSVWERAAGLKFPQPCRSTRNPRKCDLLLHQ